METLLDIQDLKIHFSTERGLVRAVEGVDLSLNKGQVLGVVGESGSGKTVTSLSILNLLPRTAKISGKIMFQGKNLLEKTEKQMEKIRGNNISMIFQEPMTSLNPVYTIGEQIKEVYRYHTNLKDNDMDKKVLEMLELVKIPDAKQRMKEYPHQMSGGIRQRVMIAMSLACDPEVLIADEPTTALDVTVQGQILALIRELQEKLNTAVLLITHDLGVVAQVTDQVAVMYAGQVVEYNDTVELFKQPKHPYTKGLISTIPRLDEDQEELQEIEGMVPDMKTELHGCHFYSRCQEAMDKCADNKPELTNQNGSLVRCFLYEGSEQSCPNH
ncbi:ABC transporter ATP-binding protein [Natranaerobius thermophilus]|uniref:Oligopeptide/dipeptide ABC transporter, ATPase subunit n=1 Tax=Natranaerobius thermophilus (strain ATCC BAA-1301 / DSM 18059 / JW/NM-WN-LF) TaxID=457570 RepID=B2A292_NATTJ|nr:ABC transporter ATP-binding protein [Natranaerobius thermophilus]ACB86198.1 oligopeptide/dipeptide ABC transporter, ATPase subunit [Natranaerobius thermophilus JW/NM-WN-LF]